MYTIHVYKRQHKRMQREGSSGTGRQRGWWRSGGGGNTRATRLLHQEKTQSRRLLRTTGRKRKAIVPKLAAPNLKENGVPLFWNLKGIYC